MTNYIFAGRFQPFHIGHLEVLKATSKRVSKEDNFIVAVVSPFNPVNSADENFRTLAVEHHLPERNPWSVSERIKALGTLIMSLQGELEIIPTITAIPRPDFGYDTIVRWFPEPRIWIIPSAGEDFDDSKALFFQQKGDEVLRIDDNTNVSGYHLRTAIKNGDYNYASQFIPEEMHSVYFKSKGL